MANGQHSVSDDRDLFLEYLLRSALTAPNADTSPTAGRILARLLVVAAIEGGDALVTPYLVPSPGEDATFDVRAYRPGNLTPTDVKGGLGAALAIKVALRAARDSDDAVEVVSRSESGLERCVLVRDSTGDYEFRFASGETLSGHPIECAAARRAWKVTLSSWRAWVAREHPGKDDRRSADIVSSAVERLAELDVGSPGMSSSPLGEPEVSSTSKVSPGWGTKPADDDLEEDSDGWYRPNPSEEQDSQVGDDRWAAADFCAAGLETSVDADADAESAAPAPPADLAAAAMAIGQPVDVDLSQVEPLLRRALDRDRHELVEPLARRLSTRLGNSLELPTTADFVNAVLPHIPRPHEVADAVTADIAALLSETLLRRRPGDLAAGTDAPGILVAVENIQVQLDGLRDQVRKSTDVLSSIGDRLEAGDRRAAVAQRLSTSIDQEMHRLANRIDQQVTELATSAGGGSELADGVARLTRKLRQSVDQLDRALVRLDEMVEESALSRPPLSRPPANQPAANQPAQPAIGRAGGIPPTGPRSLGDAAPTSAPGWTGRR